MGLNYCIIFVLNVQELRQMLCYLTMTVEIESVSRHFRVPGKTHPPTVAISCLRRSISLTNFETAPRSLITFGNDIRQFLNKSAL